MKNIFLVFIILFHFIYTSFGQCTNQGCSADVIEDVHYEIMYASTWEQAADYICLPSSGKTLTIRTSIDNGEVYSLRAGNSIKLKEGFKADSGSHLIVKLEDCPDCSTQCPIEYVNSFFAEYPSGDKYKFYTHGADSYEFSIRKLPYGGPQFYSGRINKGRWTTVWQPDDYDYCSYRWELTLYSYCWGAETYSGILDLSELLKSSNQKDNNYNENATDIITQKISEEENTNNKIIIEKNQSINFLNISPNPTSSKIAICDLMVGSKIEISDSYGMVVEKRTATGTSEEVDLSGNPVGIYLVKVTTGDQTITEKVMLQ